MVGFNFTERWFRDSGLYNLNEKYQMDCIKRFIIDKCNWSKQKLQKETKHNAYFKGNQHTRSNDTVSFEQNSFSQDTAQIINNSGIGNINNFSASGPRLVYNSLLERKTHRDQL